MAGFAHASAGYTFDAAWTPRVRVAWDYASGDADPNDGQNNRFDTLFGARRFEYGPTGIYGAVFRANLNSPEIRLILKPNKQVTIIVVVVERQIKVDVFFLLCHPGGRRRGDRFATCDLLK